MSEAIVIPRLGLTMEEGRLVEWYVRDGEAVEKGDPLFAVETDKVVMDVEAPQSGVVHHRPDAPQEMVPIGTLIGYIAAPGETITWPAASPESAPSSVEQPVPAPVEASTTAIEANGEKRASPAARRRAQELNISWANVDGSSRDGHVLQADVEQAAAMQSSAADPDIRVSPVARRVAEDLGVDIAALAAQKPGARIQRRDVEEAATHQASSDARRIPVTGVRRVIAERMSVSAHTTAPVTLTTEADATELVKLRSQIKADAEASGAPVPSYNDLFVRICAQALTEHPRVNAWLDGDEIVIEPGINIGLAVDTDDGLKVPVLRDITGKSLRTLAIESADLIARTQRNQLTPDDLTDGTFTITNLGMYEIDVFTPIINLPQTAILGIGRIRAKQIVLDAAAETVGIRQMVFLSLTFDHRLLDGAPAARFLQRVKRLVEEPYLWLVA